MKNITENENNFEKGTVNIFSLLNIVTKFDICTAFTQRTLWILSTSLSMDTSRMLYIKVIFIQQP
jgi:hypothetical protein